MMRKEYGCYSIKNGISYSFFMNEKLIVFEARLDVCLFQDEDS